MCSIFPHQNDCHFKHSRTPINSTITSANIQRVLKEKVIFKDRALLTLRSIPGPCEPCAVWDDKAFFFAIIYLYLGHQKVFFHRGPKADELPLQLNGDTPYISMFIAAIVRLSVDPILVANVKNWETNGWLDFGRIKPD